MSISFKGRKTLLATSIIAACAVNGNAVAEDEDARFKNVERITITALKRKTTVEETGMAVSAIGEQELTELVSDNFADYLRSVPGVNFTEGVVPGSQDIVIRGVNFPSNRFQLPTIGIYLDETALTQNGRNPDISLLDVNRVEVLRGPQGTLYGSSSMGGTIRYITNKADPDLTEGWVEAGIEHTDEGDIGYRAAGMFNLPVSEKFALRGLAYVKDLDGWIDNVGYVHTGNYELIDDSNAKENINNDKTVGGRLSARYLATENLTIDFSHIYHDQETDGLANWNPNLIEKYGKYKSAVRNDESYSDKTQTSSLQLEWRNDFANVLWISTYTDREYRRQEDLSRERHGLDWWVGDFNSNFSYDLDSQVDENGDPTWSSLNRPIDYELTTHEFRLVGASADEKVNWVTGVYYSSADNYWAQREVYDNISTAYSAFRPFGFSTDYQQEAMDNPNEWGVIGSDTWFSTDRWEQIDQLAVYGNVSYQVTPEWEVSFGGRWFDVDIDNDYIQGGYFGGTQVSLARDDFRAGAITEAEYHEIIAEQVAKNYREQTQFSQSEDDTQFMFSTNYNFGDQLVYFTVAEGYRIGGVNRSFPLRDGSLPVPQSFDSDSLVSTEIGFKGHYFDRQLIIDSSIYQIDWEDIQLALTDPVTDFAFNANAGEAEIKGFEVSVLYHLTESIELNFATTVMDHEVTSLAEQAQGVGIAVGDPLLGVSDERFSFGIRYGFEVAGMDGFVRLNTDYTGDYINDYVDEDDEQANINAANISSFSVTNLTAGLYVDDWMFQFYAKNLFNKEAVVNQERAREGFNDWHPSYTSIGDEGRVTTLRPLTIGAMVRYAF